MKFIKYLSRGGKKLSSMYDMVQLEKKKQNRTRGIS